MRTVVLQHVACEPPGVYEDVLRERGAVIERIELDEGDPLPDWTTAAVVVVMGGPMGAYEDDTYPWLAEEKRWLAAAVAGGVPVFGVCLGAQLLAAATGGAAMPGPAPEVGLLPVRMTAQGRADPVTGRLPASVPTLQWHGDTFELPPGAVHLAESPAYPHQAFRLGHSYGVQFHLEVSPELAAEWAGIPAYARALAQVLGPEAGPRLLTDYAEAAAELNGLARLLFEAYLDELGVPPAGEGGPR